MIMIFLLFSSAAAFADEPAVSTAASAVELSSAAAVSAQPPQPPAHAQRLLQTATDVARDFADTAAYLEAGQIYYRAYARQSRTLAEEQRLLEFQRDYQAELDTAKKEEAVLRDWLAKAAALR
jgi:hypothetical protein